MQSLIFDKLQALLPLLSDRRLIDVIAKNGQYMSLKAGHQMIKYGDTIRHIPIILNGLIKIQSRGEDGKDTFLYYLVKGNTCPSSFSNCLASNQSDIKAIVMEDNTELVLLPAPLASEWMTEYSSWNNYIMQSFQNRFKRLLDVVDEITYSKIDERLLKYLLKTQALTGQQFIQTTHQQIANDLNSSREVISRLLKKMEHLNYVKLSRNKITLLNLPSNY